MHYCAAALKHEDAAIHGEDFLFEKKYVMDTGCGYDLTCKYNMQEDDIDRIYERGGEGLTLYSASGPVSTHDAVDMYIVVLGPAKWWWILFQIYYPSDTGAKSSDTAAFGNRTLRIPT